MFQYTYSLCVIYVVRADRAVKWIHCLLIFSDIIKFGNYQICILRSVSRCGSLNLDRMMVVGVYRTFSSSISRGVEQRPCLGAKSFIRPCHHHSSSQVRPCLRYRGRRQTTDRKRCASIAWMNFWWWTSKYLVIMAGWLACFRTYLPTGRAMLTLGSTSCCEVYSWCCSWLTLSCVWRPFLQYLALRCWVCLARTCCRLSGFDGFNGMNI